ncbi:SIS domain-containing protein, partial [Oleiphilus sp. HI0117]
YFSLISEKTSSIDPALLRECASVIQSTHTSGGKLLIVGNGGSAAMASHLTVDFLKSAGVRAMNFNEADLITCFSNDYGYEHWVSKAFEAYADPGDLAIIISSSGRSANMLNAAIKASKLKLGIITVSGFTADNPLRQLGDINLWVDSKSYNVVEMTHHIWLLSIIDFISESKARLDEPKA